MGRGAVCALVLTGIAVAGCDLPPFPWQARNIKASTVSLTDALEQYRRDNELYPRNLQALVPRYLTREALDALPQDLEVKRDGKMLDPVCMLTVGEKTEGGLAFGVALATKKYTDAKGMQQIEMGEISYGGHIPAALKNMGVSSSIDCGNGRFLSLP